MPRPKLQEILPKLESTASRSTASREVIEWDGLGIVSDELSHLVFLEEYFYKNLDQTCQGNEWSELAKNTYKEMLESHPQMLEILQILSTKHPEILKTIGIDKITEKILRDVEERSDLQLSVTQLEVHREFNFKRATSVAEGIHAAHHHYRTPSAVSSVAFMQDHYGKIPGLNISPKLLTALQVLEYGLEGNQFEELYVTDYLQGISEYLFDSKDLVNNLYEHIQEYGDEYGIENIVTKAYNHLYPMEIEMNISSSPTKRQYPQEMEQLISSWKQTDQGLVTQGNITPESTTPGFGTPQYDIIVDSNMLQQFMAGVVMSAAKLMQHISPGQQTDMGIDQTPKYQETTSGETLSGGNYSAGAA